MNKELTIKQYIEAPNVKERIQEVLKNKSSQFVVSLLSAVNTNEALAKCEPKSVMNAAMTAASLDLPINPNLGFAYIIPYKGEAQFQMGYKGFVQLAMRSGQFHTLNVTDVREGEIRGVNRLSGEIDFTWLEEDRDKTKVVGYVAYMRLLNGFEKTLYMTSEELTAHGVRFSQTMKKGYGLWKDDFDAMAKKTVIKMLLSKYAPMTTDMAKAQEADQAVINDKGYKYIDNKKITASETAIEKEKDRVKDHIANAKTIDDLKLCEKALEDFLDPELNDLYEAKRKELSE
jgi:recombination protein RecT